MPSQNNKLNIETPDHIDLEFKLAGPGARFLAYTLDICYQIAIFSLLLIIIISFGSVIITLIQWSPDISEKSAQWIESYGSLWIMGFLIFIYGVITLGYFAIFEHIDNGRTPGKKWINIRVMRSDGVPLAPWNVIVRNVLRVIDIFMCCSPVGLVVMMVDKYNRRLGDLAGGTVVIVESAAEKPKGNDPGFSVSEATPEMKSAVAGMSPDTYLVLSRFLERMNELEPQKKKELLKVFYERVFKAPPHPGTRDSEMERLLAQSAALYREKTRVL